MNAPSSAADPSAALAPARLLSAVAVVGRDNEPIYLRGDLCSPVAAGGGSKSAEERPGDADAEKGEGQAGATESIEGGADDGEASPSGGGGGGKKGIFGRFRKGADATEESEEGREQSSDGAADDDGDPFGFFGSDCAKSDKSSVPAMSLTQQLVLHASLDRFEERASRSSQGGAVRWRTPGSTSANGMWMGLLCEVEERWNVYGYLTNTGIKFMILVENVCLSADGTRRDLPSSTMRSTSADSSRSREADLKNIFAWLHELYVRHTMNPFSRLRSPIQSRTFDGGIVQMAQSFNGSVLEQMKGRGGSDGGSAEGLVWM